MCAGLEGGALSRPPSASALLNDTDAWEARFTPLSILTSLSLSLSRFFFLFFSLSSRTEEQSNFLFFLSTKHMFHCFHFHTQSMLCLSFVCLCVYVYVCVCLGSRPGQEVDRWLELLQVRTPTEHHLLMDRLINSIRSIERERERERDGEASVIIIRSMLCVFDTEELAGGHILHTCC
jgi:hypothetical protein